MKKLILLLLCTVTLGLASCKKDTIVQNILPRTILTDITSSAWKTKDNGKTFYAEVSVPENDGNFNQSGGILVSLAFDSKKEVFDGLPNVFNGFSYRFTSEPNFIVVYLEDVNGATIQAPGNTIRAKIVLVDSEIID